QGPYGTENLKAHRDLRWDIVPGEPPPLAWGPRSGPVGRPPVATEGARMSSADAGCSLACVRDLEAIVKAYDIRGVVPDEFDEDTARALGRAAALVLAQESTAMVVGHDMRTSSPGLAEAFADGVTSVGVDVVDAGLTSTDQLYFASGALDLPGAMFTASHNPARYNGIKLCRAGAAPVGRDTGLAEIKKLAGSAAATE